MKTKTIAGIDCRLVKKCKVWREGDMWSNGDLVTLREISFGPVDVWRPIKSKKAVKAKPEIKPVKAWAYIYEGRIKGVRLTKEELSLYGVPEDAKIAVLITPLPLKGGNK